MDDFQQNSASEDIEAIKKDLHNLGQRLKNLKDTSKELLAEQVSSFKDTLASWKDKGADNALEGMAELSASTREHPMRNLSYAFIMGALATILLRRD